MTCSRFAASTVVFALALALLEAPAASAANDRAAPCSATYDVQTTIAKYGDQLNEGVDIFVPTGRPEAKLLVFVHGGGWTEGFRSGYAPAGKLFASCGIAFASVDYTLAPDARPDKMAAEIGDAIAFLQRNATRYGYAKAPVFLAGHSAGAQLVAYAATLGTKTLERANVAPASIGGVILLDGLFYDPPSTPPDADYARFFTSIFGDQALWQKRYGLKAKLTGHEAPMLVVHGTTDDIAPEADSREFYDTLRAAGDSAEYLQPPGLSHNEVAAALFNSRSDLFARVVAFIGSGSLTP